MKFLYVIFSLFLTYQIQCGCLPQSFLTNFNFSEVQTPQPLDSSYCYGLWSSQKFCLKNEESFVNGFQQFIDTSNERRQKLFQMQIDAIELIVNNRVNTDNSRQIFGENAYTLYPLLLDVLILRFKKIYSKCYENLNKKILDIFCYMLTEDQQNYFVDENSQKYAQISGEYVYEITKNCLETFRGYCIILKYLKYRATELNQYSLLEQIIPQEVYETCDNRIVACVSDYSDKDCDEEIKNNMVLNLINSNGLVGEQQLEELLDYYLYGKGTVPTKKTIITIQFRPKDDEYYIPLQNPTITQKLNLQISHVQIVTKIFKFIFIFYLQQLILINIMKFEISTFVFFCLFNLSLQTLILQKKDQPIRKLAKKQEKKIVYKIKQDPITREMNIEKIFDSRQQEPNKVDNSEANFEYDQNEDGKYVYRPNPHMKIMVGDLQRVPQMLETLREDVESKIFLEIKTGPSETRFYRSTVFYKKLPVIKQNYFLYKMAIEDFISKIRNIVEFVEDYIYNTASSGLEGVFTQSDIELDDYNKEVVKQLLEKLIPQIQQLWDLIFNDLRESFEEVEETYENENESAQSKAETLIRNSIKLTILEKEITKDYYDKIKLLTEQIKDNKHYHHLADVFEQSLDFAASEANDPLNEEENVVKKLENSIIGNAFSLSNILKISLIYMMAF